MADTEQQVIARIRLLLRRVSDIQLPDETIRVELNRLCRSYLKEEDLGPHARRIKTKEVAIDEDEIDFTIAAGVTEFEATKLEYGRLCADGVRYFEAQIVPFQAWARHSDQPYLAAAFYGRNKVRLNITAAEAANYVWLLSYQDSLLSLVQAGADPPLKPEHISMLEHEAAINLMPQVDDDSPEWIGWMGRTYPVYRERLKEEKTLYALSISKSDEPQIQNVKPWNSFRRRGRRTRATIIAQ